MSVIGVPTVQHSTALDHVANAHSSSAVVPYAEPEKGKDDNEMASTLSSTLPMAAVSAVFHLSTPA
jgi:hypothetical protein